MAYSDTIDAGFTDKSAAAVRYASFGPRLLAALLDFLITIPAIAAVVYFTTIGPNFTIYLLLVLLVFLYKPIFEALYGATPGKMILKLKVLKEDGTPIGWSEALTRVTPWFIGSAVSAYFTYLMFQLPGFTDVEGFMENAAFMLEAQKAGQINSANSTIQSLVGLLPLFSALVMLFNKQRQAAHDILAKTVVIHTEPKASVG
jgi:uncharacterized RDD family membrane protein YckC